MERKWVHFLFALLAVLAVFLLVRLGRFLFETVNPWWIYGAAGLVTAALLLVLWKTRFFSFAQESFSELDNVAWPTRKEAVMMTVVVVVTVTVAAAILGAFDLGWSSLAGLLFAREKR